MWEKSSLTNPVRYYSHSFTHGTLCMRIGQVIQPMLNSTLFSMKSKYCICSHHLQAIIFNSLNSLNGEQMSGYFLHQPQLRHDIGHGRLSFSFLYFFKFLVLTLPPTINSEIRRSTRLLMESLGLWVSSDRAGFESQTSGIRGGCSIHSANPTWTLSFLSQCPAPAHQ